MKYLNAEIVLYQSTRYFKANGIPSTLQFSRLAADIPCVNSLWVSQGILTLCRYVCRGLRVSQS